jgi:hypothetical protein
MDKVYLVWKNWFVDAYSKGMDLIGIFSSEEKAEAFAASQVLKEGEYVEVEEEDVQ